MVGLHRGCAPPLCVPRATCDAYDAATNSCLHVPRAVAVPLALAIRSPTACPDPPAATAPPTAGSTACPQLVHQGVCTECSVCGKGQTTNSSCDTANNVDTTCTECPPGFFQAEVGGGECTEHNGCDGGTPSRNGEYPADSPSYWPVLWALPALYACAILSTLKYIARW